MKASNINFARSINKILSQSILLRLLIIVFIFFGISCKKEQSTQIKIGFSQCISEDIWREEMNHSM
ncbi:MAG: hypothetical protein NWQ06_11150, partial [Leeuwenhoekiella sp.]|nr:hypothetical protein [Leeuwenhoekiella sp.]